jgi:alkanesulfonate monooxygenase SsuD/methylene tetrahydromethanopterin reductase-like flavin-dependent oxidoreductase (luciferase family)
MVLGRVCWRPERSARAGWQREEYEAAGLTFEGRGRLLDHTLEVCQTLWRNRRASYHSPELQFVGIHQMPKPMQVGGVPIWISGTVRKTTASRIARFGYGWIPWGEDIADLPNAIPRMKDAISSVGGNPEELRVVGPLPVVKGVTGDMDLDATMDRVPELVESGITEFSGVFDIPTDRNAAEDTLRPIVRAFRAAVGRPVCD